MENKWKVMKIKSTTIELLRDEAKRQDRSMRSLAELYILAGLREDGVEVE